MHKELARPNQSTQKSDGRFISDTALPARNNFSKFATSTLSTFVVRTAVAVLLFGMNVVVVHRLGAHEAGVFFLGQTVLLVLGMLSRGGMDNVLVRYISTADQTRRRGAENGVLATTALFTAPLTVLIAGLVFANASWICNFAFNQPDFTAVLRLVAIGVLPFAGYQLISFALQGKKFFVWSVVINSALLPLAILIAAVFPHQFGITSAIELTRFSAIAATAIFVLSMIVWWVASDRSLDSRALEFRKIIGTAFPTFGIAICSYANTWSPHFVLAAYCEPDQVAVLSVSQRSAALLALVLLPLTTVASPTFAVLFANKQFDELRNFVRRVNGVTLLMSFPLLTLVFVLAPQIMSIFGPQFSMSFWVLRILVFGQLCNAITGGAGYLLLMSGNERQFRNSSVVSTLCGIVLALFLIPEFGVHGAAIAGSVSQLIWNAFIWIQVYKQLGINVFTPDLLCSFAELSRIRGVIFQNIQAVVVKNVVGRK